MVSVRVGLAVGLCSEVQSPTETATDLVWVGVRVRVRAI